VDLEPLRQSLVRVDFVVGDFSARALKLGAELPGSLLCLSMHNAALQAKHLLLQSTKFQAVLRYRSAACRCKVVKPARPFIDTADDAVFLPVIPNEEYPVALEVTPEDHASVLTFQFVSKFILIEGNERRFLLRVANFSFKTTTNAAEFVESANWNAVLWFWCRRVCDRDGPGSVSAILRVAASLLKSLGDRFDEGALRAVCALPRSQLFSGEPGHCDRVLDLLSVAAPRHLKMIPRVQEGANGRTICQSIDGVAEERNAREQAPSRDARKLQMALPVYVPIPGVVPLDCATVSPAVLANLQAIVKA
jgi:hypothetical protein